MKFGEIKNVGEIIWTKHCKERFLERSPINYQNNINIDIEKEMLSLLKDSHICFDAQTRKVRKYLTNDDITSQQDLFYNNKRDICFIVGKEVNYFTGKLKLIIITCKTMRQNLSNKDLSIKG